MLQIRRDYNINAICTIDGKDIMTMNGNVGDSEPQLSMRIIDADGYKAHETEAKADQDKFTKLYYDLLATAKSEAISDASLNQE